MHLQKPDDRLVSKISTRLESLGVSLGNDNVAVVVSAMLEWITSTREGKEYFVKLFGFDWVGGDDDKNYYLLDTGDKVSGEDIYFLKAAVAKGRFVPMSCIDVEKITKDGCDECGALVHCARNVVDSSSRTITVCNSCLSKSDNTKWRDKSGGDHECRNCTVVLCQNHPRIESRKLA